MTGRKLVFRKALPGELPVERKSGNGPDAGGDPFSRIFGALKGTVTIAPGVDLTMPTHEKWDAEK